MRRLETSTQTLETSTPIEVWHTPLDEHGHELSEPKLVNHLSWEWAPSSVLESLQHYGSASVITPDNGTSRSAHPTASYWTYIVRDGSER